MISKDNAEHYIWGEQCDGWRLVNGEDQSIIHERMPPSTYENRHYHKIAKQFFFVLSGEMEIEIDGVKYKLQQHQGKEVQPSSKHQVFNNSLDDLEFLVISQPSTRNDRVEI